MLNKLGGAITVYLEFKNLPTFCSSCNSVGHVIAIYRHLDKQDPNGSPKASSVS